MRFFRVEWEHRTELTSWPPCASREVCKPSRLSEQFAGLFRGALNREMTIVASSPQDQVLTVVVRAHSCT